jgi:hypothetical protein
MSISEKLIQNMSGNRTRTTDGHADSSITTPPNNPPPQTSLREGGYNNKFKRIFQKLRNFYYCSSFLQTNPAMISTTSGRIDKSWMTPDGVQSFVSFYLWNRSFYKRSMHRKYSVEFFVFPSSYRILSMYLLRCKWREDRIAIWIYFHMLVIMEKYFSSGNIG